MTSQRIRTGLGELHVEVTGVEHGESIVFWPSLLMDGSLWAAQVAHLATSYRTIVIDPPGHGRSEAVTRTFGLEECADAVVAVLDALGVERTHVVGNSWGAMIGGVLAATHPERVGRAVLMNGTASPAPWRQRVEYASMRFSARLLRGIRGPLVRPVLKAFLGPTTLRTRPDVVEHVARTAKANDVRSAMLCVRSVVDLRADHRALFGRIAAPVLVVAGREDATFPVAELAAMAGAIPGARLEILEDAAHLVALEVPDRVNAMVAEFLGPQ